MDKLQEIFKSNHKIIPYLKLAEKTNKKLSVQINLTNKCSSKCKSCRKYEWPQIELDLKSINNVLWNLAYYDCETITFSGGEPLLYSKFKDIKIPDTLKVNVLTSLVVDKAKVEHLLKIANSIQVSLDGHNKQIFEQIRGVDAFDLVINNLKYLKNNLNSNQRLRINCTVSKSNAMWVKEIFFLAQNIGVDINFYPVHTWENLKLDENNWLMIDAQIKQVKEIINGQLIEIEPIKTNLFNLSCHQEPLAPICIIHKIHAVVDANGDVYPCCHLLNDNGEYGKQNEFSSGNIYTDTYSRCFEHQFKYLPKSPECLQCNRYRSINNLYYQYTKCNQSIYL